MSRTLSTLQAVILGLALLVGVGLIATAILAVGSRKWFGGDSLSVRAGFNNVQGVEVGTKVRVRGMDAGEVESLEAPSTSGGQVFVRLRVNSKLRHLVRKDASVQIVSVGMLGGKAVEIDPGSEQSPAAEEGELLKSRPTTELADVMDQMKTTLSDATQGKGTLGMLTKDPQAYQELIGALRAVRNAAGSIQEDAEAIKKLPIVGKYVEDAQGLLNRTGWETNRKWFPETKLFEAGRSTLTRQGKDELDDLAPWLEGLMRHKKAELVVVSYGDTKGEDARVKKLTQDQSKAVLDYLDDKYNRQLYFLSYRKAASLGMGTKPPITRENANLPTPRVEILVFVPQS